MSTADSSAVRLKRTKCSFSCHIKGSEFSINFWELPIVAVPPDLTNDRSDAGLIAAANSVFHRTPQCRAEQAASRPVLAAPIIATGTGDPEAKTKIGSYFIPSAGRTQFDCKLRRSDAIVMDPVPHSGRIKSMPTLITSSVRKTVLRRNITSRMIRRLLPSPIALFWVFRRP